MSESQNYNKSEIVKRHSRDNYALLVSVFLVCAIIVVSVIIVLGYIFGLHWVGVLEQNGEIKTMWDWMELLIIPIVLTIGAFLLNKSEKAHDRKIADEQRTTEKRIADQRLIGEQDIARDTQRQKALETYFDRMTELLLEYELRKSKKGDEVRSIARARTLTVLHDLDGKRRAQVVKFLYELDLIIGDNPIIDMSHADLQEADLPYANLNNIFLPKVNLRKANLYSAKLQNANFNLSDLDEANLSWADLKSANLHCGLKKANLGVASLEGASLFRADMNGACLINARLNGADLRYANLKYKHEPTGDMDPDNIDLANLNSADLSDCNMTGAKVETGQIKCAKNLKGAIMPSGKKFENCTDVEEWQLTSSRRMM